jgi:hypothetical protein
MEAERLKVELSDENVKMILERGLEALVWVPAGGKIEDQASRKCYELSHVEYGGFDFGTGWGYEGDRNGSRLKLERVWSYEGERSREDERDMFDGFPIRREELVEWDPIRKSLRVVRRLLKKVEKAEDSENLTEHTQNTLQWVLGTLREEEGRLQRAERVMERSQSSDKEEAAKEPEEEEL